MKPMSSDAHARYEKILAEWRQEGRKVSWKEYREAFQLAMEETDEKHRNPNSEGGRGDE